MMKPATIVEQVGFWERRRRAAARIRALLLMQMGDKLRKKNKRERRRSIFITFLLVLASLAITAVLAVLCYFLIEWFQLSLDRNMLAAMLLISQAVSVLANAGTIQNVLFTDRENSMLLTFPCTFNEIAISKLLLFFLRELKKNCFFLIPFLAAFAIITGQGIAFYLFIPLAYLLLSALPILLGCVLAIAFLFGKRWLESKPVLYVIVLLAGFSLLFYIAYRLLQFLPAPIEFLAKYEQYIRSITGAIAKVADYSLHYGSLADIMTQNGGTWLDWVILLGSSAFIAVGGISILIPFYFRAVSSSAERSTRQKRVRVRTHESSRLNEGHKKLTRFSLYRTFLRKELIITVRDVQKLSATITSFFVLPIVSFVMNEIFSAIATNALGDVMAVAFNLMISASLLAAFNTDCACALSMEGLEFCVLKTAPSNTMSIAWAKITVTLLSNFIAVSATTVMLYIKGLLDPSGAIAPLNLVLMTVTLMLLAAGMVLWSFQLDVRKPLFLEYASKGAAGVVNNPNVGKATLFGFVTATLTGVLSLLLLFDDFTTGWLRILGLALLFCVARAFLFYRNLQVYFHEIEL